MAKTKRYTPSRVRSEEERSTGGSSGYITLDEGENFTGFALFEADPKVVNDAGYYEYHQHWATGAKQSVPCAGADDCPLCDDGERPKTVAKTLWFVVKDEKKSEVNEVRIFNFNWNLIQQFTDMRSEGDKIKGRLFRIGKMDAKKGTYSVMPKDESKKATEVKEIVKEADIDFEEQITAQLNKAMQGVVLKKRMEDDDEPDEQEDEKEEKKSSKGKAKGKSDKKEKKSKKDTEDWPDELDEVEVVVVSVDDDGEFFTASHEDYDGTKDIYTNPEIDFDLTDLEEDDVVIVTTGEQDNEGDYVMTDEPEVEGGGSKEDEDDDKKKGGKKKKGKDDDDPTLPDEIEDVECVITGGINEQEGTLDVNCEELELDFTLYVMSTVKGMDWDDYEEGTKIKVSATKDSTGDLVTDEVPEIVKSKSKKEKGEGKKKGGKKK